MNKKDKPSYIWEHYRVPLPKQSEKAFKSIKDYNRKKLKKKLKEEVHEDV